MKILVIDDDAPLRRMVIKMLRQPGWEILEASDGQSGLTQARTHLPDVILCDFDMEGINGHETLALLRATDATATIPFIVMTGAADRAGVRQSMDLGADDYLAKPFDQAQLLKCVQARLARARLDRRQVEQKLAALRASIVAAFPHGFRTPLNGILGFSELLATDCDSFSRDEINDMTKTIHESAVAMNLLVNRFLNYTDLLLLSTTGSPGRNRGPGVIDAGQELANVARRVAARHRREEDLVLDLGAAKPAVSREHLARLAEELIDNACKFSVSPSKIEISVTRGDRFVLKVRDAGRGLTPEQIADVGAFLQFDRRRYEQQGTGLGLATAQLLASVNEGQLLLQSNPERGTTATVLLPLAT